MRPFLIILLSIAACQACETARLEAPSQIPVPPSREAIAYEGGAYVIKP